MNSGGAKGTVSGAPAVAKAARVATGRHYTRRLTWQLGNWGFLAPHLAFFVAFAVVPVVLSAVMSFYDWSLLGNTTFLGVQNYQRIWADQRFWQAVGHTVVFAIISVPLVIVVGLVLATILNQRIYGKLWLLICFVSPTFFASVGVLTTWQWIFSSTPSGLANHYLLQLGILKEAISWFETTQRAWGVILLVTVWWIVGFSILLYLGGLQRVPAEQYEAAKVDGAGPIRRFVSITLPWIRNILFFDVVRQVLLAFGLFDQVYFFTSGGPAGSTRTMVWFLYLTGFDRQQLGRAAAVSWYVFLVVAAFGLIQIVLLTRTVRSAEE